MGKNWVKPLRPSAARSFTRYFRNGIKFADKGQAKARNKITYLATSKKRAVATEKEVAHFLLYLGSHFTTFLRLKRLLHKTTTRDKTTGRLPGKGPVPSRSSPRVKFNLFFWYFCSKAQIKSFLPATRCISKK